MLLRSIHCNNVVDLLKTAKDTYIYSSAIINNNSITEVPVTSKYEVNKVLEYAYKEINGMKSENESHIIFTVKLYRKSKQEIILFSEVCLVILGNSDFVNDNSEVAQFAAITFDSLANRILSIGLNKKTDKDLLNCPLIKQIDKNLNMNSNIVLITCVNKDQEEFEQSLAALKFINQIRERIHTNLNSGYVDEPHVDLSDIENWIKERENKLNEIGRAHV